MGQSRSVGRFISYLRVGTVRQGKSGLGLEAQREAVNGYLNGGRWKVIEEEIEVESGKHNDRPQIAHALALCRLHNATLIVAKLDRLARNVAFLSNLMEARVDFVAADFPTANRLTVHILAAVAEHEGAMISARTKAALGAAKARGVKLGGDRAGIIASQASKGNAASLKVRLEKSQRRAADVVPVIEDARAKGATTLRQIADDLNKRGIPAAKGGQGTAMQISRVLRSDVNLI